MRKRGLRSAIRLWQAEIIIFGSLRGCKICGLLDAHSTIFGFAVNDVRCVTSTPEVPLNDCFRAFLFCH